MTTSVPTGAVRPIDGDSTMNQRHPVLQNAARIAITTPARPAVMIAATRAGVRVGAFMMVAAVQRDGGGTLHRLALRVGRGNGTQLAKAQVSGSDACRPW
ncbi:hypothetical protein [Leifsonia sp. P73]|uniref:hypothetical protein n=1 Tax=Leifsonia sp. P73 TaxID=3423959 RepID=UPI003DA39771